MEQLPEALRALGISAEVSLSGRWAKIQRGQYVVYVVEALSGTRYYSWCDHPLERAIEVYPDPKQAIEAALRRCEGRMGATSLTNDTSGAHDKHETGPTDREA